MRGVSTDPGSDVIRRIDLLRFAQQAGFRLEEIRILLRGSETGTPLSARWRSLAETKLRELDELMRRIRKMRRALELSLRCGCVRLEDCSLSPVRSGDLVKRRVRSHQP